MPIANGLRIGNYEVAARLGSGGMGEVYIAKDLRLSRKVALKILPPDAQYDTRSIQRFIREAQAASALNHPNIVTIHETGESEVGHFIVMELVEGKTVRSLIGQPPSLHDFVHVAVQIAEGLTVAHAANIIHRDIKPENLMVRDDGYVKILDFGLARQDRENLIDPEKTISALTGEAVLGSLRYMSPEQARGERLTSATDVFSLGIVLYEFATGRHPFGSGNGLSVVSAILSQDASPPSRLNPGLPGSLDSLILRMLDRNPSNRPNASEVKNTLVEPDSLEVLSVATSPSRLRFVGRKKERAQLHTAFESTVTGKGSIVCLEGEAGLGKTTLMERFLAEASSKSRCFVGRGRSSERLAGTEAYLPILEAIESLLAGPDGATAARLLKLLAPTWYLHAASISDTTLTQTLSQSQAVSQDRIRREFSTFLLELSRSCPVVLFLDDLHWSDVSTVDLLVHLASKLATNPVLVVLTYRSAEMQLLQHPFLRVQHDLQARGVCQTISLDFLTKEDLQNYLELEFAHPNFPPEFLSLLHARTEGNALFMVDVLRYLKEQKVIAQVNQRWVLSETVPDIDRQLPESVRGMIQRNIDMLGEDGRRLLVAASVEGYEFHASIIAQVLNLDPADVEEQLDELDRRHGFIRVVTEEELPDGMVTVRCRFVHVLYQSALYASLKPARRASLSGAVARALENSYKHRAKEIASGLAILFEAAREFDRCAEYFYQAALNARNVFAFQEAVILARRGLAALRPLEKTPSLLRTEVLLHLTLGIALLPIKGFGNDEVRDNFDAAYQSRHAIEPGRELVAALAGLFEYHIARLEIPTARQLAEQLIDLGLQGGFPAFAVRGREALGVSMFFAGNFEEAIETLEQALHQYEAGEYRTRFRYYDIDLSVVCLTIIGRALTLLGYLEQGKAKVTKAVEVALSLPDPYSQCWAYQMCAGTLAQTQADPAGLEQAVEALISIANENGLAYWKAHGIGHKGWLLCLKGNLDEGIALLRRGREGVAMSGTRPSILYLTGLLAEALARHGRTDEALEILESEMADADRLGMTFAELARIRAYLLAALSRPTDSEIWFESAISTARSQNARLYQLKTLTTWLRCSSNDSQRQRIRSEIAVLLESMTEGRDWPVLIEARQALGSGSES